MTNPVTRALAEARLPQLANKDDAMLAVAEEIVGPAPKHDRPLPAAFVRFCERKGTTALPASIGAVALFVLGHQGFGLEAVLGQLADISGAHCDAGLADPTTAACVTGALSRIAKIEPPRSWPKAQKARFLSMSYDLQLFVAKHEEQRERAIHKAHQEAADLRHAQQRVETTNENPIEKPAA
jgi:hypothetical protein